MSKSDIRVDAYIKKSPEFARPILTHLRALIHEACPGVQETVKWGVPSYEYHGILCGTAAFKTNVRFGFWKPQLLTERGFPEVDRLTSLADLPPDSQVKKMIKTAAELNEQGIAQARPKRAPKPPVKTPPYFLAAVKKNKKALANFQAFSPSHKREYVEWITDAKGEDTRARRVAQAITWIAEGKSRNWKYQ